MLAFSMPTPLICLNGLSYFWQGFDFFAMDRHLQFFKFFFCEYLVWIIHWQWSTSFIFWKLFFSRSGAFFSHITFSLYLIVITGNYFFIFNICLFAMGKHLFLSPVFQRSQTFVGWQTGEKGMGKQFTCLHARAHGAASMCMPQMGWG